MLEEMGDVLKEMELEETLDALVIAEEAPMPVKEDALDLGSINQYLKQANEASQ